MTVPPHNESPADALAHTGETHEPVKRLEAERARLERERLALAGALGDDRVAAGMATLFAAIAVSGVASLAGLVLAVRFEWAGVAVALAIAAIGFAACRPVWIYALRRAAPAEVERRARLAGVEAELAAIEARLERNA